MAPAMELAQQIEAMALAEGLRRSRWVYPMVSAGHILGLALLLGAVVPMDLRILRGRPLDGLVALRAHAAAGLALAVACGGLLFAAQATEYAQSPWFATKLALLAAALLNAALYMARPAPLHAGLSIVLWPAILICGRMIAYG